MLVGVDEERIPNKPLSFDATQTLIDKFNFYRDNSIAKLKIKPILDTPIEALSLNGIMMRENDLWDTYGINENDWNQLCSQSGSEYVQVFDNEQEQMMNSIINVFSNGYKVNLEDIDAIVERLRKDNPSSDEAVKRTLQMLTELSQKLSPQWKPDEMTEDSLTMNVLDPIVFGFLGRFGGAIVHGSDYELPESKTRKRKMNGSRAIGRKPDRCIEVLAMGSSHHVFLMEIKTAKKSTNRPDLVKIASMMKDCLDAALSKGYNRNQLATIGLLQEGRKTTILSLITPSNSFNCFTPLSSFTLPADIYDMDTLKKAVEGLHQCRSFLKYAVAYIRQPISHEITMPYEYRVSIKSPKRHAKYYS